MDVVNEIEILETDVKENNDLNMMLKILNKL